MARRNQNNDDHIYEKYADKNCQELIKDNFPHPTPTQSEVDFPLAYAVSVYKGASLLERLVQAIYMPHNFYCIHVDRKSSESFLRAVRAMTKCLPNVYITNNTVDVIYPHISILQAQINCMSDLMDVSKKWKYFINLVGQDYPLYGNGQIVKALQGLNGLNMIESFHHPKHLRDRTEYAREVRKSVFWGRNHDLYELVETSVKKPPPPHNITLLKGANHITATREFIYYILHNQVAKDFYEWLKDTESPPETFYSSMQQHPGTPGGLRGTQPDWIMRAIHWDTTYKETQCYGQWKREICWLDMADLRWVLGVEMRYMLFVQKLYFEYDQNLIKCLDWAREDRKYGRYLFKQMENSGKESNPTEQHPTETQK